MFVSLWNSYVEVLTPKTVILEGKAFGKQLCHEVGDFMSGLMPLLEELAFSLSTLCMWWYNNMTVVCKLESGFSPGTGSHHTWT